MIRNVVDLGNSPAVQGDLPHVIAGFEPTRDLPALRAHLAGAGTDCVLEHGLLVFLRAGSLVLQSGGRAISLAPGQVASVPRGMLSWQADAADVVLAQLRTGAVDCAFEVVNLAESLSPGRGQPNAALVTTPMPSTGRNAFYDHAPLGWGLWSATPYDRSEITYGFSELMYLQSGSVTLSNADEGSQTFIAGDVFIVHRDAKAAWSNLEPVQKLWLIHSPE